jgi:site-specific recombinase XerD
VPRRVCLRDLHGVVLELQRRPGHEASYHAVDATIQYLASREYIRCTCSSSPRSEREYGEGSSQALAHLVDFGQRINWRLEQIRRILPIPLKKTESRVVQHLTVDEMQAILDAPNPTPWTGVRDRALWDFRGAY